MWTVSSGPTAWLVSIRRIGRIELRRDMEVGTAVYNGLKELFRTDLGEPSITTHEHWRGRGCYCYAIKLRRDEAWNEWLRQS